MGFARRVRRLIGLGSAAVLVATALGRAQAPQTRAAPGGGRGGSNTTNAALWTAFDADQDGSITRAEMRRAVATWYDTADTAKSGSVTTDQLGPALNTAWGCNGPGCTLASVILRCPGV